MMQVVKLNIIVLQYYTFLAAILSPKKDSIQDDSLM